MTGQRRLADDRVPRPRRAPVLRRHLLPERRTARACPASCGCMDAVDDAWRNRRDDAARAGRAAARRDRAEHASSAEPRRPATRSADVLDRPRSRPSTRSSTPRFGGFGGAPKFPQAMTLDVPPRARTSATPTPETLEMVTVVARRDGRRRHVRPGRRRLPPLLGRRVLARPPLREDALRPGAARRAPTCTAGSSTGRAALPPDRRGDRRATCCATCATPTAASSPPRTPTPRASRASSTSGRSRSSTRCCGDDAPEVVRYFGVTARRQLRGPAHRLPRQHPPRRRPRPRTAPDGGRRARCPRCSPARASARASRARRQGAARLERAVPALARRGRGRARARRLDGRGPHQRPVPLARAAPRRRPPPAVVAGRPRRTSSRYAEDYAALLEALLTLAEVDDVAWLAEARDRRRRARPAVRRRRAAAGSSPPAPTPRRSSCARRTSRTTRRRRRTRSPPTASSASPRSPATPRYAGRAPRGGSRTLGAACSASTRPRSRTCSGARAAGHAADRGRDRRRPDAPGTAPLRARAAPTAASRRRCTVAARDRARAPTSRPLLADRAPRRRHAPPRTSASTSPAGSPSPTPTRSAPSSTPRSRPASTSDV